MIDQPDATHPNDLPDFTALLPRNGRLLGLDVGSKTVGLATSDALRGMATPLRTIERVKFHKDAAALATVIRDQRIAALVVGLPLNMDATEGPRCQSVRQFVANLRTSSVELGPSPDARRGSDAPQRTFADIPILMQDERLSTAAVERTMIDDYDMSRGRRAERVDAAAAAWILQTALDRLKYAGAGDAAATD